MSYSGSEPVELLAFRARLCGITTEAQTITELGAQMRQATDPGLQSLVLKIWLSDVRQAHDAHRLLALIYLANDVIQLLRGSEQAIAYRYKFAIALAEAIILVRQRAPTLIPKIARVLSIFRDRTIYDTYILDLLQRVLQDDLQTVTTCVIPLLREEITQSKLPLRFKKLEYSIRNRGQVSSSAIPRSPPQQSLVSAANIPPPSLSEILKAGKQLELLSIARRPQQAINLDAEVVSRIRGYRIPLSARINQIDAQLIDVLQAIVKKDKDLMQCINDKASCRKKEAGQAFYSLLSHRSAPSSVGSKILILLKKEWNLRCEKVATERILYWHLITIFEHLIRRWNRVQAIAGAVEAENQRRAASSSTKRSEPSEHMQY